MDELEFIRNELKKLLDVVEEKINSTNKKEHLGIRIPDFSFLLRNFPVLDKNDFCIYTNDLDVKRCLSSFETSIYPDIENKGNVNYETKDFNFEHCDGFSKDFGFRIKETIGDFVAVDVNNCLWGYNNWKGIISEIDADFVVLFNDFTTAYCYDELNKIQVLSVLENCSFFIGEDGWISEAASLFDCGGIVLTELRGNYPNLAELTVKNGIKDVPFDFVSKMVTDMFKNVRN